MGFFSSEDMLDIAVCTLMKTKLKHKFTLLAYISSVATMSEHALWFKYLYA